MRRSLEYGLRRRNEVHSEHEVREIIKRENEGPSSPLGYYAMWNKLRTSYSIAVPCWDESKLAATFPGRSLRGLAQVSRDKLFFLDLRKFSGFREDSWIAKYFRFS